MQRRVFLFVALFVCVPAMALASTITVPNTLLTKAAGQVISLTISGTDLYTDSNFDGLLVGPGTAPVVTHINGKVNAGGAYAAGALTGTVWGAGGAGGITGGSSGTNPQTGMNTSGFAPQNTAGTYLTLTIDSSGASGGPWTLDISNTNLFNGLDENFEAIPNENFLTVNGQFSLPVVPEPSSVVLGLFAVAGLAAVAIRRRRAA